MLGATTTLLYGLNILFDPVHENLPQDPENPGLKLVISSFSSHSFQCPQSLRCSEQMNAEV